MEQRKDESVLAQTIQRARVSKGYSVRELARLIGVRHRAILLIEQGITEQPKPETLMRLAEVLDLDQTDLLTLAGYTVTDRLPTLSVYLRSTTQLPSSAIGEMQSFYDYLRTKYGVDANGPAPGEDEQ